jgi:ubiquinone/menaquinone biosynthesis C-methylase UbiE
MNILPDDRVSRLAAGTESPPRWCASAFGAAIYRVDRSRKMIDAATRRNAKYVAAGKAEFIVAKLEEVDLGDRCFDKIFAVRVGLFYRVGCGASPRWLCPGGQFTVFDPP